MTPEEQHETGGEPFHQLLTGAQSSLYAFICSLLGGAVNAADVLQETNLVLWEKSDQFDRSREFLPWAFRFAHMQVLAFRKAHQRDRLAFGDDLIETLAAEFERNVSELESRLEALDHCLTKLSDPQRDLIHRFYEQGTTLAAIGASLGKTAGAMAASLYRIRKTLADCVERTLRREGTA